MRQRNWRLKKTANSPTSIKHAALRLLARRDHGVQELKQKLLARRFSLNEISLVLQELQEQGLLSEERFIKNYITYRSERGFGPLKIQQDLQTRGVSKEVLQDFLWSESLDWLQLLKMLCEKKFGGYFAVDAYERAKQIQYLQRRGFTLDLITQITKSERHSYENE